LKYFIITGTSRGLGEAIAEQLIHPNHHLICISRNRNESLIAKSEQIDYLRFDLSNVDQIEALMEIVFSKIDEWNLKGLYLINNAAVVTPLSHIELGSTQEIINNVHVNLLAPVILTSLFIRFSQHLQIEKRVLNISSMSAKSLLPGLSVYSATKAGLDIFSESVGIEQGDDSSAVKVVSIWPGLIDTGLQEEARNANKDTFASTEMFAMLKDRGLLVSPAATADRLIELLLGDSFIQGSVIEELHDK
jgi:benzil reductase ((S)-benzoin forming)